MNFELIVNKDKLVGFYMPGGGKMLHDLMPVHIAISIINQGNEIKKSDKIKGFPLCVDDKYYFEAKYEA